MRAAGRSAPGFDYLRLGLALYVFWAHCFLSDDPREGAALWESWFGPIQRSVLPMFFALSGFLVAGSFARNTIAKFAVLRALRIVPALATEVALSAIVLGPVFTELPLSDYLQSHVFWSYFLNIVGDVHFVLPGVFVGKQINGQLWTIPFELKCYLALVALSFVGKAYRRSLLLLVIGAATVTVSYIAIVDKIGLLGPNAPHLALISSFLFGVCIHMFKDKIYLNFYLFCACVIFTYVALNTSPLAFLAAPTIAYLTVYLGLTRPPPLKFGDLSYGVYIYHGPILAVVSHLSGARGHWRLLLLSGLPLTLGFALLSWRLIESPILHRKALVLGWVDRLGALFARRLPLDPLPPASQAVYGSEP